jgi:transposase
MSAKTKYRSEYHDPWAWSLAIKGATDEEIAQAFGVSRMTIQRWMNEEDKKSFAECISSGKRAADAAVEKKLYERCLGYTVTEVEKQIEHDEKGMPHQKQTRIREKHIPSDTMAIMYSYSDCKWSITAE